MKSGITYKDVKGYISQLAARIPGTEDICTRYTLNIAPCPPEMFFLSAEVDGMKIELRVEGMVFLSEADDDLGKTLQRLLTQGKDNTLAADEEGGAL